MDKEVYVWFSILTIVCSFILLSSHAFQIYNLSFGVFLGIVLMPVSMASMAAGLLEGPRRKVLTMFLMYVLFFGILLLAPSFI